MSQLPIDLESETINLDGRWTTRDELAKRIKAMLDSGDFAVSKPSQALELLTSTLASVRTLSFRSPPDLAEALNSIAARRGKSVGAVIRDALAVALGLPAGDGSSQPPGLQGRHVTDPEIPVVTLRPAGPPPAAAPAPAAGPAPSHAPPLPIAGPGAMKAAGPPLPTPKVVVDPSVVVTEAASAEDAKGAVDLTSKKTKEEEAVERRWFGG